jgi:hypothetical protein
LPAVALGISARARDLEGCPHAELRNDWSRPRDAVAAEAASLISDIQLHSVSRFDRTPRLPTCCAALAALPQDACARKLFDPEGCAAALAAVKRPGGATTALRPGALCTLLGSCPLGSCNITDPSARPAGAAAPLDRCTASGTAAGALPPGTNRPGARPPAPLCMGTADCAGNASVCEYPGTDCAFKTCDPETGADACVATGTCQDPCQTPSALARLAAGSAAAPPCKSASGGWLGGPWSCGLALARCCSAVLAVAATRITLTATSKHSTTSSAPPHPRVRRLPARR